MIIETIKLIIFAVRGNHYELGLSCSKVLNRLGSFYIKVGQIVAAEASFINEDLKRGLSGLYENANPVNITYIQTILNNNINLSNNLERIDDVPLATASIAQVHKIKLKGLHQDLVVKVVKPRVREEMNKTLARIGYLIKIGDLLIPRLKKFHLRSYFDEISEVLKAQCDMKVELENYWSLRKGNEEREGVYFPKVYQEYCNSDVMVMECLEKRKGTEIVKGKHDYPELATLLLHTFYSSIFIDGFFQADTHPGNIFFDFNDKGKSQIFLLDYGLVGKLTQKERLVLAGFFFACMQEKWKTAVERFYRQLDNTALLDRNYEEFEELLTQGLKKHFYQDPNDWTTFGFLLDTNKILTRYGARLKQNFSLVSLALLTGEGFVKKAHPRIDFWAEAKKYVDLTSPFFDDQSRSVFHEKLEKVYPTSFKWCFSKDRRLIAPSHLDRFLLPSEFPIVVKRAEGAYFYDYDDNEIIDLSSGYGPHILGYNHPVQKEALSDLSNSGNINCMANVPELELASKLCQVFGDDTSLLFANSGTESISSAIRIARAFTGKQKVFKFQGHFHGQTDQALVSTVYSHGKTPVGLNGFHELTIQDTLIGEYADEQCFDQIRKHAQDVACVIVEPLPMGTLHLSKEFLLHLREICTELHVALIFDEVVSGFRVCFGGIQHQINVEPDLTCLGKVIGGGLPMGAVVGKRPILDVARTSKDAFTDIESKTLVGGTFSGNMYSCALGLSVLNYLEKEKSVYDRIGQSMKFFNEQVNQIATNANLDLGIRSYESIFKFERRGVGSKASNSRDHFIDQSYRDILGFSYYMRERKVYIPELHGLFLNLAHTTPVIDSICERIEEVLVDMKRDGYFHR